MTTPPDASSVPPLARFNPLALALGSSALFVASFPLVGADHLAWVALTPLFALAHSPARLRLILPAAYVGGLAFWLPMIHWVNAADPSVLPGWLLMAAVLAFSWPVAVALLRLLVGRFGWPLMLAAPLVWVAVEHIRAYEFTGFPWYNLAHTQADRLCLIQSCDLAGTLGLTAILAVVNAALVDPLGLGGWPDRARLRRLGIAALMVAAAVVYGMIRLDHDSFRPGPRVALIQTDFPQRFNSSQTRDPEESVEILLRLTRRALDLEPDKRPNLVVWPETSYPYIVGELPDNLSDERLAAITQGHASGQTPSEWRASVRQLNGFLQETARAFQTPLIVGATRYRFRPERLDKYNSAILFEPDGSFNQVYDKLHLVPFGEYVPLIESMPFLVALTPYRGTLIPSLQFGSCPQWFEWNGLRMAAAICFEDTVPQVVRRLVRETPDQKPPDLLINLSNDGWFRGTQEQGDHLNFARFRCVEHRLPMVRAVNTGISAVIDGDGRIVAQLEPATSGVLSQVVPLDDRRSLYTLTGEWLGPLAVTLSLGAALVGWVGAIRDRRRLGRSAKPVEESTNSPPTL